MRLGANGFKAAWRISCAIIFSSFAAGDVFSQHSIGYLKGNAWWRGELIKTEAPAYPAVAKRYHVEGKGIFRAIIDPNNGKVITVLVLKTTGFGVLDDSAGAAIRHWLWKPRRLKQVDVPVVFQLQRGGKFQVPPDASPLPQSRY